MKSTRSRDLFLIPKQIKEHGLKEESVKISDDAVSEIIHQYTREAGVRNLEREITSICRKVARQIVKDGDGNGTVQVDADDLSDYLGPAKFTRTKAEEQDEVRCCNRDGLDSGRRRYCCG